MSFYWYLSNYWKKGLNRTWSLTSAIAIRCSTGSGQLAAGLHVFIRTVYDVMNTRNSWIWTADCNNVCANDPPSYGCYLSNTTVTYKTFIETKLNLSSSYTYCRLQNLANSVLTLLIWVKLKKIYYSWLSENCDLHITTCSSLGAPSIFYGRFCANWAY